MKLNVTVRTDGQRILRHRFEAIQRAPMVVMQKVGEQEVRNVQERIRSGKTTPDGQPWTPWAMSTLRSRMRDGSAGQGLLYRTGSLLNSIQMRISNKTLTIFSNLNYARFIQEGTMKMPARQFLGWSQQQLNNIKNIMKDEVK